MLAPHKLILEVLRFFDHQMYCTSKSAASPFFLNNTRRSMNISFPNILFIKFINYLLAVRGELAESGVANNDGALLIQVIWTQQSVISALTVRGKAMA